MAKKDETSKEVATRANHAITTDDRPDFLKHSGPARGSENVQAEDMVIPRLELVQGLSPCLKESDAGYIDGAKIGNLYNNVTRELYGKSVDVIPVFFKKEYIVWKHRKLGGGFVGAFPTMEAAEHARGGLEKPDEHQINDTANMFCLLVNPTNGKLSQIVVSMAVTKLKVARQWNSLIRLNEGDSFSRVYTIGTAEETNKKNEAYQNLTVKSGGYVTLDQYNQAEALYELVKAGIAVADRSQEESGPAPSSDTDY